MKSFGFNLNLTEVLPAQIPEIGIGFAWKFGIQQNIRLIYKILYPVPVQPNSNINKT